VDAGERSFRNHRVDDLDRVVLDHAQVREPELIDAIQRRAHARPVHLDSDVIGLRVGPRDRGGRLAHAAADLEHDRRAPAEDRGEVDRRAGERNAVSGSERLERARLRRGQAPLAQHVAAHRTADDRRRLVGHRDQRGGSQPPCESLRSSVRGVPSLAAV